MQWIFGIAEHCDSLDSDHRLFEKPFLRIFLKRRLNSRAAEISIGTPPRSRMGSS
jgi:hypothetical protein